MKRRVQTNSVRGAVSREDVAVLYLSDVPQSDTQAHVMDDLK